ncbi:DNA double-strand break repair helicase HerA [Candidatus Tiddalikarchaeum anstoanum]|nr:DNA double-strand break repair helicase HerA [Candidatus Tiddalikarchaeum anstoanum]
MGYDIVLGRLRKEYLKLGTDASALLGKMYVTMGKTTSLANNIYMDVNTSHAVLIAGKRGGGKSYTMGVMAEAILALPDFVRKNIGMLFFDTMGVYWTTKYPNYKQSDDLDKWKLSPVGFENEVIVYVPSGYYNYYKDRGVPVDKPFTINPTDLSAPEWCTLFNLELASDIGVCIERAINLAKKLNRNYSLDDIKQIIQADQTNDNRVKSASYNRFESAEGWGLFDINATPLQEFVKRGKMSVIDISVYASASGGFDIRSLVIGIVCRRLLENRMVVRKLEELQELNKQFTYFSSAKSSKEEGETEEQAKEIPLVWLFVDEGHEFFPKDKVTLATQPLIQILREGRQPGVNLVIATQQPGKIHTDAITQSDIVISHRLTAELDLNALGEVMSAYTPGSVAKSMNDLPKLNGAALIMDDKTENVYPVQVRPRLTWHGGGSPTALPSDYETPNKPEEY